MDELRKGAGADERRYDVDFEARINAIINRPVTPEAIDNYAISALDDLADVAEEIADQYNSLPTIHFETKGENEDAAFNYFKLDEICSLLDHIADKGEELQDIDGMITWSETHAEDKVFLPPQDGEVTISPGDGSFSQEKESIPRVKTILFILANEFNVDVQNPDELKLITGTNLNSMMRKDSYKLIEVPELERIILACDEPGNASFVLNSEELCKYDEENNNLTNLTKKELEGFLYKNPEVGRRLVYSKNFVSNMIKTIKDPTTSQKELDENVDENAGKYLKIEKGIRPEGFMAVSDIMMKLGLNSDDSQEQKRNRDYIKSIAKSLNIKPEDEKYYSPTSAVPVQHYSEENAKAIIDEYHRLNNRPEGSMAISDIMMELGLDSDDSQEQSRNYHRIRSIARSLNIKLEAEKYFSPTSTVPVQHYSEENTKAIIDEYHRLNNRPEGFMAVSDIIMELDLDSDDSQERHRNYNRIKRIAKSLNIKPEAEKYFSPTSTVPVQHYSEENTKAIIDEYKRIRG